MQIELLCVGKLKEKYLTMACDEYSKRLSRFCKLHITELKDEAVGDQATQAQILQAMDREGERLLSYIGPRDYVVSLCVEGKSLSSEEFAEKMETEKYSEDRIHEIWREGEYLQKKLRIKCRAEGRITTQKEGSMYYFYKGDTVIVYPDGTFCIKPSIFRRFFG